MQRLIFAIGSCGLICILCAAKSSAPQKQTTSGAEQTLQRTQTALRLQLNGDDSRSRNELEAIVAADPQASLARWSLGFIQAGAEWVPFERFVHETHRWPELYKYQQERAQRTGSFEDQLLLADGCRAHDLADEERAHLYAAVLKNWNSNEAHTRRGDVNIDGVWILQEQFQRFLQERALAERQAADWKGRIQQLHGFFEQAQAGKALQQALAQLHKIHTPDAIPAMERYFASQGVNESMIFVDWVARLPSVTASLALARQAVFSEAPTVRAQAQHLLRGRRFEEYVPWLLGGLETTTVESCDVQMSLQGMVALRVVRKLIINGDGYQLNLEHDRRFISDAGLNSQLLVNGDGSKTLILRRQNPKSGNFWPVPDLVSCMNCSDQLNLRDLWFTAGQDVRVGRILRALEISTQMESLKTPDDWWSWWREQHDTVLPQGKQISSDRYQEQWYVGRRSVTPLGNLKVLRLCQCFAAGTLVETEQGPRAIETLQIGDRVLAQDIDTGELAFQPVFGCTLREQADLVRLRTTDVDVTCSPGHNFWVVGEGWRMAEELKPGTRLHLLNGNATVESVTPAGTGSVYNLIVPRAHSYFAGANRLYTHDVTAPEPTDMVLPGLRKEFQ